MRHKKNNLSEMHLDAQKMSLVMRNMLTSLVLHGHISTTEKKAKIIASWANKFFSRLVRTIESNAENDSLRENIRYVKSVLFTQDAWKKVISELLPRFQSLKTSSYVASYKLWTRKGDGSESVMVKIV